MLYIEEENVCQNVNEINLDEKEREINRVCDKQGEKDFTVLTQRTTTYINLFAIRCFQR